MVPLVLLMPLAWNYILIASGKDTRQGDVVSSVTHWPAPVFLSSTVKCTLSFCISYFWSIKTSIRIPNILSHSALIKMFENDCFCKYGTGGNSSISAWHSKLFIYFNILIKKCQRSVILKRTFFKSCTRMFRKCPNALQHSQCCFDLIVFCVVLSCCLTEWLKEF